MTSPILIYAIGMVAGFCAGVAAMSCRNALKARKGVKVGFVVFARCGQSPVEAGALPFPYAIAPSTGHVDVQN